MSDRDSRLAAVSREEADDDEKGVIATGIVRAPALAAGVARAAIPDGQGLGRGCYRRRPRGLLARLGAGYVGLPKEVE